MKKAVILFTRVPIPGRTKTRLMPFLSGEACAALHRELIRSVCGACRDSGADVLVCYTPEDQADILKNFIGGGWAAFFPQRGKGLGERMSLAFTESFRLGYEKVLLVGTDIPGLSAEILMEAFASLESYDAVVHPTVDGGYYLIGLKGPADMIWDVPHYGKNTVFQDTLFQLERAGLRTFTGRELRDIDTKEDLMAWYGADRCIHCGTCTRNCRFLKKYKIDLAGLSVRPELAYSCFLCGRCKEVCPKDIDGARIALLERRMQTDRSSYQGLLWEKNPYKFANYRKGKRKSVLFPGCNFTAFYPKTTKYLEQLMKRHGIGTVYDCCGKPVFELGFGQDAERNLEGIRSRLEADGVEELITLCPNCYYFLKARMDKRVVTVYQKLKELNEGKVLKMDQIPVYYPCPDRKEKAMFRSLSSYLEGEVTEPFETVQCCGLGGCGGMKEPQLSDEMAASAGILNKELYTYCASCISSFRRKGTEEAYHILPLILGIQERVPLGIQPFINRARRKLL